MELPVSLQAAQFLLSGVMGAALGLVYDLLRALRRKRTGLTALCDTLFSLCSFGALAAFALYPGQGQFRLFVFLGLGLGAVLYFLVCSPLCLRLFDGFYGLLGRGVRLFLRPMHRVWEKFREILKKLFASAKKCSTIFDKIFHRMIQNISERSAAQREIRQVLPACQVTHLDSGGIRYDYAGQSALPDLRKRGRGRRTHQQHHRH